MRITLGKLNGDRLSFRGKVARFGRGRGWNYEQVPTLLMQNVTQADGRPVCDHLWFDMTKGFKNFELQPGDTVQFEARVERYLRGYQGERQDMCVPVGFDFKLSRPTRIRRVKH